jgi:hypothetical protein
MVDNNALKYGMNPDLGLKMCGILHLITLGEPLIQKMDVSCVRLRNIFASHSRLCLRCVDQCACILALPQPSSLA